MQNVAGIVNQIIQNLTLASTLDAQVQGLNGEASDSSEGTPEKDGKTGKQASSPLSQIVGMKTTQQNIPQGLTDNLAPSIFDDRLTQLANRETVRTTFGDKIFSFATILAHHGHLPSSILSQPMDILIPQTVAFLAQMVQKGNQTRKKKKKKAKNEKLAEGNPVDSLLQHIFNLKK